LVYLSLNSLPKSHCLVSSKFESFHDLNMNKSIKCSTLDQINQIRKLILVFIKLDEDDNDGDDDNILMKIFTNPKN